MAVVVPLVTVVRRVWVQANLTGFDYDYGDEGDVRMGDAENVTDSDWAGDTCVGQLPHTQRCESNCVGFRVGDELTRPLATPADFPLQRATHTTSFVCPSLKGHFLSARVNPFHRPIRNLFIAAC